MQLVLDTPYDYRGFHGCASRCRLRVYRQPTRKPVVIVTDLGVGTSVTNSAEKLATEVSALLRLCSPWSHKSFRPFEPGPPVWFEHYTATPGWHPSDPAMGEHFRRVYFEWDPEGVASRPDWGRAQKWEVEAVVGRVLTEARP